MTRNHHTSVDNVAGASAWSGRAAASAVRRLIWCAAIGLATATTLTAQVFTSASSNVTDVRNGASLWGDYDGNDQLDALLTGRSSGGNIADIFDNTTGFSAIGTGFTGVGTSGGRNGSAWGDFDRDGDLDLAVTGETGGFPLPAIRLYRNNGSSYSPVSITGGPLFGSNFGDIEWGDFDNDGDLDLFSAGSVTTVIYRNDGQVVGNNFKFNHVVTAIPWLRKCDAAWGDYDNDGDLDIVVSGEYVSGVPLTKLYKNQNGVFINSGVTFENVEYSAVAWGDYDNDGDLDLALSGDNGGGSKRFRLYNNNGSGGFTLVSNPGVTPVSNGSLAWGDYDNDGDLDLLVTGHTGSSPFTDVFVNNGGGFVALSSFATTGLTGVYDGQGVWGDYDNDGRLDILLSGENSGGNPVSRVYYHDPVVSSVAANSAPSAPTGVSTSTTWKSITMSWTAPSDPEGSSLSYNVQITDVTNALSPKIVMSAMANTTNGFRRVAELGNANHNTSWTITGLTPGNTYSICVQAIDGAWAGSTFACGTNVTLPTSGPSLMIKDCPGDNGTEPNPACSGCYWNSDALVVRQNHDWGTTQQGPLSAQSNYVYVEVTNLTGTAVTSGTVDLYFSHSSTLQGWQYTWVNYYKSVGANSVLHGDYIGSATIGGTGQPSSIPANGSARVWIEWQNVPDPSDFQTPYPNHYCLIARLSHPGDPLVVPEGMDVLPNTKNNNNIAWRNVYAIDTDGPQMMGGRVLVGNATLVDASYDLVLTAEALGNDFLTDHCDVTIDLGQDLLNVWGGQGTNIEFVEGEPTKIRLTGAQASLNGLTIPAGAIFNVLVEFDPTTWSGVEGVEYLWHMAQHAAGDADPLGGQSFLVKLPTQEHGRTTTSAVGPVTGDGAEFNLSARPNPSSGSTTIAYMLPDDTEVTISIYDANGSLVRTLIGSVEQEEGSHEIEWDGTGENGEQVPAGTYFYRLQTEARSLERQIIIVR